MTSPAAPFAVVATGLMLLVLQQVFISRVELFGVHIDLLLLFALCVAIARGPERGALTGFAAGLAVDLFMVTPLGASALAYAVAAFVVGYAARESHLVFWVSALFAFAGTAFAVAIFAVAVEVSSAISISTGDVFSVALVSGLINAALAPFFVHFVRNIWPMSREAAW